ncbi:MULTISPECIES: calcium/sodium antiporter [Flavobacteriaceae]|uniref:Calcium/sodium antiporter n=2 Tax=Flavobacteriaceae TaxID=49546 RepID=A0A4Y8AUL2_9FLAO|nr:MULTISPECIES: calcium/sodium antiporter [Flavobacteriaceae]TEW75584.1 calcium/sodium antiporter [Gramella jeungdoensis]
MNLLFIAIGLVLLILGGNWLLKSAVGFSLRLQIPKIVIGMTVVSFATSAPELIVSIKSALDGHADLALGNVIGSNIANLGLVLAITILISTISVEKSFYKTDWPVMIIASFLLYGFIAFDGVLVRYEGVILFSMLIVFLIYLLRFQKKPAVVDELPEDDVELPLYKNVLFLTIGGVALWGGSELLIEGAVGMATKFNVSERVIGITIVSIGTSIPELAASVIAILKKEKAISLGNLIGSNVFNILAVLGLTSIITPITVKDQGLLTSDIYWMLGISLLIFPLVFAPVRMKLSWKEGLILIALYGGFIYKMIA